jgi:hypothetical protein
MMTKAAILRCIKDMESKLVELRAAVEELPEVTEARPIDTLADLEQEETEEEANGLSEIFATLRAAWTIPPDVKPDMPLEELQKAMVEGLPENWASRELLRMREE